MGSDLRIGIIGAGRIGQFHLETCAATAGFDVVAACDPSDEVRNLLAGAGISVHRSAKEMVASEELDAAFVCAPPVEHIAAASACAAVGVPVLCEKPFGTDTEAAVELLRISAEFATPIVLASKFRHVRDVGRARELLREGAIGSLVHVEIEFCDRVEMTDRWNTIPSQSGGGVIVDAGSHAFDLLEFVAGPLCRVHATRMKQVQPFAVEDGALIQVELLDGVTASVTVSWSLPPAGRPLLRLRGTRGEIAVGWRESWLLVEGEETVRFGSGYDKVEAHRQMYEGFRRVLRSGGAAWITNEEILRVSEGIESAYRSIESASWVALPAQHGKTVVGALSGR